MKKRHLRLIISKEEKSSQNTFKSMHLEKIKDYFECLMLSKNEKIYIIKNILINIYRDYEKTTGITDIPYFVRAESMLSQIIRNRQVDYYYNKLKKMRRITSC